jgi:hypothetical protein
MIIKHNEFYEFKINLSIIILMNFKTLRWVCTVPTVGMHRTHGGYAPYPRWVCTVPTVGMYRTHGRTHGGIYTRF